MSSYDFIEFIDLVSTETLFNFHSGGREFSRMPKESVEHWVKALGYLLMPLEYLMFTKEDNNYINDGEPFSFDYEHRIIPGLDSEELYTHSYCCFIVYNNKFEEIENLKSAIKGFESAMGINMLLNLAGAISTISKAREAAQEKKLIIYPNNPKISITIKTPRISDMVFKSKSDWVYVENTFKTWKSLVEFVTERIERFPKIALSKTHELLSKRYINAYDPLSSKRIINSWERKPFRVLDSLSSGQFGLIIGEEGIGKTMLSLEIALELSNQKEQLTTLSGILDIYKPGSVLGVFQEDDKSNIETRAKNIGARLDIKSAPYFGVITHEYFDATLDPNERKEAINNYIYEALAYKGSPGWRDLSLIIIDPIGLLIEGDESNAEPMKGLCNYLSKLAKEHNCAILGIHHPTKSAKLKPYGQGGTLDLNAAAGHPILTRCARWVLNISRSKKDAIKLKVTKSNNGELSGEIHQLVKVNDKGEPFKSGDNFAGFALTKLEGNDKSNTEKIFEALQCIELSKDSKTKVIGDICKSTGYSRNKVREALEQLEETGRIESSRTAKGIQLSLVNSE